MSCFAADKVKIDGVAILILSSLALSQNTSYLGQCLGSWGGWDELSTSRAVVQH